MKYYEVYRKVQQSSNTLYGSCLTEFVTTFETEECAKHFCETRGNSYSYSEISIPSCKEEDLNKE